MLLADVVAASDAMRATSGRNAKVAAMADALAAAKVADLPVVVAFLAGEATHQPLAVGPATVHDAVIDPAERPTLTVADVDAGFAELRNARGRGSKAARRDTLERLLAAATAAEQSFLVRLILGELRQGALAGIAAQAIARAFAVSEPAVRRAVMLQADLGEVARAAAEGGTVALGAFRLELGRPVQPMLATSAETVDAALAGLDAALIEHKLDGARVQVHRDGQSVRCYTRNLRDVTDRLPEVVAVAASLPAGRVVLDGEVLGLDPDGRPEPFQQTMRRVGAEQELEARRGEVGVTPFFFDVLHVDGRDLLDEPLSVRREALEALLPSAHRVTAATVAHADQAARFTEEALAAGQEGVMVKDLASPYAAGRRGSAWRKVKPVHTLDLIVLAVEWGSGRRRGWLSNLHVGARDPAGGEPVMLGKTFKGLTDETLAWQTERFLALERRREGHVVHVEPVQVVEVAIDGVQRSPRYPAGMALRFARVVRYRHDKTSEEADTVDDVRAIHTGTRPPMVRSA